jgi:hypothetical protein
MKKSEYTRSTVECRYDELKPVFRNNVRLYAEDYKLGDVENEVLHCFETTNLKKGFLGRVKTNYTEICFTKRFLFWIIVKDKDDEGVGAAQWADIVEVREWADTEMGQVLEESGVELFGFLYRASRRCTWFIGIGKDDAGNKCASLLKEFIKKDLTIQQI